MKSKIDEIRRQMAETLQFHFARHLNDGILKIHENIEPYSRFIRSVRIKFSAYRENFIEGFFLGTK